MIKLFIPYMPPNWNEYINMERGNKYRANKLKQDEKNFIKMFASAIRYTEGYPVELILRPHFKGQRQDLDNFRYKGLLDGLVSAGVLKNDNLKHIQKIVIDPVFDSTEGVEVEMREL